ncbi:hypothetical protein FRC12_010211 [Ceratobasidium sp. 428]|nr:hypothetical protein FRC12_010211 [Ceratobasidium sp. 428]
MSRSGKLSIHVQPACSEHQYVRDKDTSTIVERPERLRALALGIAGALARSEEKFLLVGTTVVEPEDLAKSIENITLEGGSEQPHSSNPSVSIVRHATPLDVSFLNNPTVRMIHALDEDTAAGSGEEYLSQLARWVSDVETRLKSGESEIPDGEGLSQGDLYRECSWSPLDCESGEKLT